MLALFTKSDIVVIIIILLILVGSSFYIIKAKKNGQKCIGCPYSKTCNKSSCLEKKEENQ